MPTEFEVIVVETPQARNGGLTPEQLQKITVDRKRVYYTTGQSSFNGFRNAETNHTIDGDVFFSDEDALEYLAKLVAPHQVALSDLKESIHYVSELMGKLGKQAKFNEVELD